MLTPDSGLRFEKGDVVIKDGKLWHVRQVAFHMVMSLEDADSTCPESPVMMRLEGDPDDSRFSRDSITRLVPEG